MLRTAHRLVGPFMLACLVALGPARLHADEAAEARSLYVEGQKLYDKKQFAEACQLFERSLALDPTPRTRGALAICYEDAGRPASAWLTWRSVATQAQDAGPSEAPRAKRALQKMERLRPHLTMAVFKLVGGVTDAAVILDGRVLTMNEIGLPIPVDPGGHTVEAKAAGYADWRTRFAVAKDTEGSTLTLSVGPLTRVEKVEPPAAPEVPKSAVPPPAVAAQAAPPVATVEQSPRGTPTLRYVGIAAAGVGVVGLAIGTIEALSARSTWDDAKAMGCNNDGVCQTQAGADKVNDASSKATVATVALSAGIGLVAGGALLYFLTPSESSGSGVSAAVTGGPGGAQLGIRGRF